MQLLRFIFTPIGIILIFGVFMCASIIERREDSAFATRGQIAVVAPITGYTETTRSKHGREVSKSQKAEVTFTTKEGQVINLHDRYLPGAVMDKFRKDEQVSIIYLQNDPMQTRFPDEKAPTSLSAVLGSGLVMSLGILWFVVRRRSQRAG